MARANYIAQDRTDIAYATKELSRGMSKPTRGNQRALKRLARYLIGKERAVKDPARQRKRRTMKTKLMHTKRPDTEL